MDKKVEKFYTDMNLAPHKILNSKRRQMHLELSDERICDALCWMYEQIHDHGLEVSIPGMMAKVWAHAREIDGEDYATKWRKKVLLLEHELYRKTWRGRLNNWLTSVTYGEDF